MRFLTDLVGHIDDAADRCRSAHEKEKDNDKDDLEPWARSLWDNGRDRGGLGRCRLCDRLKCLRLRGTRLLLCAGSARAAKFETFLQ
jgi:hypothetical protein